MERSTPFSLVDAFGDAAFGGNPAGVVLAADGLSDAQMQLIAREVNASETAFVTGLGTSERPPRLRWFTPTVEVGFCGHATLATGHALFESALAVGQAPVTTVTFAAACGPLTLTRETLTPVAGGSIWWLTMPDSGLRPDHTNPMRTCELLGLTLDDLEPRIPIMRTRDGDLILFIRQWSRLMELRPRMEELADWQQRHELRGTLVTTMNTLSPAVHAHSRFFAPAAGVPEDPVTGSVHGPLAALLAQHGAAAGSGGHFALVCHQGPPGGRLGVVRALVEVRRDGQRIMVGGECFTTIRGEIRIPTPGN